MNRAERRRLARNGSVYDEDERETALWELQKGQGNARARETVVVAHPHGAEVSSYFWMSWTRFLDAAGSRLAGHLPWFSSANITNARNEIVRRFLDDSSADWLWFVDTDMTFEPDIVERLLASADPVARPVMGALCFALRPGQVVPTLYPLDAATRQMGSMVTELPEPDGVYHFLTGTGCLLIHRTVLERMRVKAVAQDWAPFEWFQETRFNGLPIGEDVTFALRCEGMGVPVHVDTRIGCGHAKTVIVDRQMFDAQRPASVARVEDHVDLELLSFDDRGQHDDRVRR